MIETQATNLGCPQLFIVLLVKKKTAWDHARPQLVFEDGAYHRVVLHVKYDEKQLLKTRQRGGHQLVLPPQAISIEQVVFLVNAPPANGEERVDDWDPRLEVLPCGRNAPHPMEKCTIPSNSYDFRIIRGSLSKHLKMKGYIPDFHEKVARGTEVPNKD